MVFKTSNKPVDDNDGCGCRKVTDWGEIDCNHYAATKAAQAGHKALVKKYLGIEKK